MTGRPVALPSLRLRQTARRPTRIAQLGLGLIVLVGVGALFAPVLAPHDFRQQDLARSFLPPFWEPKGNPAYPLGTDRLGRDLLSRILAGGRTSLLVGVGGVAIAGTIGVPLGLLAGFFGRVLDDFIMRLVDIQLSFPPIFLLIAVMAVLGQGLMNVVVVLGLVTWVQYARVIRASTLSVKEKQFVEGARAAGASNLRILLRHIVPNILTPIAVIATVNVSTLMLAEASLSFLGIGIQPPTPAWGTMLAEGRDTFAIAWWTSVFPGLAILLSVLGVNLFGQGLGESR